MKAKRVLLIIFSLSFTPLVAKEYPNIEAYKTPKEHHPTSIYYDESKRRLRSKNEVLLGEWVRAKVVGDLLVDGRVVCGSCHVSNFKEPFSINQAKKLRTTASGSAICVGCHGY